MDLGPWEIGFLVVVLSMISIAVYATVSFLRAPMTGAGTVSKLELEYASQHKPYLIHGVRPLSPGRPD